MRLFVDLKVKPWGAKGTEAVEVYGDPGPHIILVPQQEGQPVISMTRETLEAILRAT